MNPAGAGQAPARATLRALLAIARISYPRRFRHRYGDDLIDVALQRCSLERQAAGPVAAVRYFLATWWDMARSGLRLRLGRGEAVIAGAHRRRPSSSERRHILDQTLQDVRHAVRFLVNRPLFSVCATFSLALGIGASSAAFSLLDAVLIRQMPVERPDELVVVLQRRPEGHFNHNFAYPDFVDYRERAGLLDGLIGYSPIDASFGIDGEAGRAEGYHVSGDYFDVLGVEPAAGRWFRPEETATEGTHPVVVISHRYWRRRFGGDPSAIGRQVTLNGGPYTVVGVSGAGFRGTRPGYDPDFFVPVMMYYQTVKRAYVRYRDLENRGSSWMYLMGRLAPGATLTQAQAELDGIAASLAAEYPGTNEGRTGIVLMPGARGHYGVLDELATPVVAIMAMVSVLLLIACANVANLLLSRADGRGREISMRLALGASRARLVRQLLAESIVLAAVGGALGLLVAHYGSSGLLAYLQAISDRPLEIAVGLDGSILAFTAGLSLLTGIIFGLAPALRSCRRDVVEALKGDACPVAGGTGGTQTLGCWSLQRGLVVAQVALSFALLAAAGLLGRSVAALQAVDPGFEPANALVLKTDASLAGHDEQASLRVYREIRERVEALPGVEAAGFGRAVPVDPGGSRGSVYVPGNADPAEEPPEIDQNGVTPGFFEAVGVPIVSGRAFAAADNVPEAPRVVIVNQALAATYWPGKSPLGEHIGLNGSDGSLAEIVGVAADGKYRSLREAQRPYIYVPLAQAFRSTVSLVVRTGPDPAAMAAAVRDAIAAVDPDLPIYDIEPLADKLARDYFETRITAWLLALLSGTGTLLAGFGLYGVLALAVGRRRREIGVRMALGAREGSVVGLVLRQGMSMVVVGLLGGLALAAIVARSFGSLVYGVEPIDPASLLAMAGFLALVGLSACYLPARRAVRVDPMGALRRE